MTGTVSQVLVWLSWVVLVYFVALNTIYLGLVAVAALDLRRLVRSEGFSGLDELARNPLAPPVSILIPAYNEEAGIVESVRAMLALQFPEFEVVVIDDGSTDSTFAALKDEFSLVEVPRPIPPLVPTIGAVLSVHVQATGEQLTVIRKENARRKTDALNVGICAARFPLLCMVDADALLESDALLSVVRPFIEDPARVVATGGVIRPANGGHVYRGRLTNLQMPRSWLARIQVVEYLRAFLLGRSGWSRLQSLLIISGAFGVFRRDVVVELGGYDHDTVGEDAELVARIHRHMRRHDRPYRIEFVAKPVCWTEVPESMRVLARQRRRWARGMVDVLRTHKTMIGNPRYGRIGMVVFPYFLLFEVLGAFVELVGFISVIIGLAFGLVNTSFAVLFFLVAFGYGILLSLLSLVIEELSFRTHRRWRDLAIEVVASVAENIGYRQLHNIWRIQGTVDGLRKKEMVWGEMDRVGLGRPGSVVPDVNER